MKTVALIILTAILLYFALLTYSTGKQAINSFKSRQTEVLNIK